MIYQLLWLCQPSKNLQNKLKLGGGAPLIRAAYFHMLPIGHFEEIYSERVLAVVALARFPCATTESVPGNPHFFFAEKNSILYLILFFFYVQFISVRISDKKKSKTSAMCGMKMLRKFLPHREILDSTGPGMSKHHEAENPPACNYAAERREQIFSPYGAAFGKMLCRQSAPKKAPTKTQTADDDAYRHSQ